MGLADRIPPSNDREVRADLAEGVAGGGTLGRMARRYALQGMTVDKAVARAKEDAKEARKLFGNR